MVEAMQIKVHTRDVLPAMRRYPAAIKRAATKGINDWGKYLSRNLKMYQRLSGQGSTGYTRKGIRWYPMKGDKGTGSLGMPITGIYLDRAKPHWVPLASNIRTRNWAKAVGYRAKKLWFRPKHWIRPILKSTLTNLKPIVQQRVGEAISRRGR